MVVVNIDKVNAFEETVNSGNLVVVHFYADWAAQCGPMDSVLDELSRQVELHSVKFVKCPAEEIPEVSNKYDITAVPTFLLLRSGKLLDRVNGANAAELTKKITQQVSKSSFNAPTPPVDASCVEDLPTRLKTLISSAPVMLFMKGTADEPRCGFSKTIIEILNNINGEYKTFDILSNEEVRQGLKTFSDWPTYPQLYVKGELIGGLDIVKELNDSAELETMIPKKQTLEERLKSLTNKSPCMVFMKGDRIAPRCGFSRQLMEILAETGVSFETFDILSDEEVRQGLKTFSNWPTYPQVYAKGELIGGLDIVKEMLSSGELVETLKGGS